MAVTIDIGSTLETAAPPTIPIVAGNGATVTVKNVAGASLAHHTDPQTLHNAASAAFTTTAGQSQAHSQPKVWLVPAGRTTITLTGGVYGS